MILQGAEVLQKPSESEWRELLLEYETSGKSQKSWCASKGISLYSFRKQLSKADNKLSDITQESLLIIEDKDEIEKVNWLSVSSEIESADPINNLIQIHIGKFKIYIESGVAESALAAACKVLMSLC